MKPHFTRIGFVKCMAEFTPRRFASQSEAAGVNLQTANRACNLRIRRSVNCLLIKEESWKDILRNSSSF